MATQTRKTTAKNQTEAENVAPTTPAPPARKPAAASTPTASTAPPLEFADDNPSIILSTLINRIDQLATEIRDIKKQNSTISVDQATTQEPETAAENILGTTPDNNMAPITTMFSRFMPSKISQKFVEQSLDQLESWFTINTIFNDNERYLVLKLCIEPETYQQVASTINAPPNGDKYNSLKQAIIKTFTDSEAKRIKSLLNDITLGDRRPSALLSEMCSLYNGPRDKIFTELFISRLSSTRSIFENNSPMG